MEERPDSGAMFSCRQRSHVDHTEHDLTNPWGGEDAFGQLKKSGINFFFSVFRAQVQCGNVSLRMRMEWSMCIGAICLVVVVPTSVQQFPRFVFSFFWVSGVCFVFARVQCLE